MARKNTLQAHERRTRALMTAPMAAFGVLLVALPLIYVPVSYTHLDVYKRQRRITTIGT